jgi:uncharacterized protein (DUF2249 family)
MEEQVTGQKPGAITLDVRADLARGDEPFARIMQAAASVKEGETLVLIAPFEPVPLYGVLAAQGFTQETRQAGPAEWVVRFVRG